MAENSLESVHLVDESSYFFVTFVAILSNGLWLVSWLLQPIGFCFHREAFVFDADYQKYRS